MTSSTAALRDRYPGIRSFEAKERTLFFGREQETSDLHGLVKSRSLVVMFAKSGIGKSSLINAGLLPRLEAERYFPVTVRFQNTGSTPLEIMDRVLASYIDNQQLAKFSPLESEHGLWHKIKASRFGEDQVPFFVFDQFEEFFNHKTEARQAFFQQLADLADHRLPENAVAALQSIPRPQRTPEHLAWFSPAEVRFLIAIRSDRLSELNEMTAAIPSVLQNRFELRPLNSLAARSAIEQPALLTGDFSSPPFAYHADTLADMLQNLRSEKADEIESFQLQILCGEIEKKVRLKFPGVFPGPNFAEMPVVTPDYLGGGEGIRQILNNYYENQIAALDAGEHRTNARHLIEDQLIADNKRVGVAVETVKLAPDLVEKLLLSRLIRRAPTHLGDVFEISHDTLVQPIAKSRDQRRLIEEKARLEAERLERERELAEQTARLQAETRLRENAQAAQRDAENARQEADVQRQKAEEALHQAERSRQRAERNSQRAFWFGVVSFALMLSSAVFFFLNLKEQWQRQMDEARNRQKAREYENAVQAYRRVEENEWFDFFFNPAATLRDSIAACERLATVQKKVFQADSSFFAGDYAVALQGYEGAKQEGFSGLEEKIGNSAALRVTSLDIFTRKAEAFYRAEANDLAALYFEKALRLDPENLYLKEMLEKVKPD